MRPEWRTSTTAFRVKRLCPSALLSQARECTKRQREQQKHGTEGRVTVVNDFAKKVYADMSSVDRVLLYMVKAQELIEFTKNMTDEDIRLLKKVFDTMKDEGRAGEQDG